MYLAWAGEQWRPSAGMELACGAGPALGSAVMSFRAEVFGSAGRGDDVPVDVRVEPGAVAHAGVVVRVAQRLAQVDGDGRAREERGWRVAVQSPVAGDQGAGLGSRGLLMHDIRVSFVATTEVAGPSPSPRWRPVFLF